MNEPIERLTSDKGDSLCEVRPSELQVIEGGVLVRSFQYLFTVTRPWPNPWFSLWLLH